MSDPSSQDEGVPDWARFFTPGQYERFVACIREHFSQQGVEAAIDDGILTTTSPAGAQPMQLGLLNLAQRCHLAGDALGLWRKIVAEHFDKLKASAREQQDLAGVIGDFSRIRPHLALRIWPEEAMTNLMGKVVSRQDLDGTLTMLAIDMPSGIGSVAIDQIAPWGLSEDELFAIALDNIRRNFPVQVSNVGSADKPIVLLSADHYYVATHALLLKDHPQCLGEYGCLMGIPHRHVVLCHPIRDMSVVQAVQALIPALIGMESEGPGSITSNLYWYHEGQFTNLPFESGQDQMRFMPPDDFVDLLNRIVSEKGGEFPQAH